MFNITGEQEKEKSLSSYYEIIKLFWTVYILVKHKTKIRNPTSKTHEVSAVKIALIFYK